MSYTKRAGSKRDRSAEREHSVERPFDKSREGSSSLSEVEDDSEDEQSRDGSQAVDQEMGEGGSDAEEEADITEREVDAEQDASSTVTPQSATFAVPQVPAFAPPPPPSRAQRPLRSPRKTSAGATSLPTPAGYAASKGASSLTLSVNAPPSTDWSNAGAFVYSPQSAGPQPSPQMPSLSPMTISAAFGTRGEGGSSAASSGGSAHGTPITPLTPYTFPSLILAGGSGSGWGSQPLSAGVEGGYSAFGRSQQQQELDGGSSSYPPRFKVKRTHESAGKDSPEDEALHKTELPRRWDPAAGLRQNLSIADEPEDELQQAARLATMASAKSGLGAGAFVFKVYHMLLDPTTHDYAKFSEDGTSFIVYNQGELAKNIRPRHFKHSNFASFVRQLNMYSFHKVNRVTRTQEKVDIELLPCEFRHPLFVRGKPEQLDMIKRKAPESEARSSLFVSRTRRASGSQAEGTAYAFEKKATRSSSGILKTRRYAETSEESENDGGAEDGSDEEYTEVAEASTSASQGASTSSKPAPTSAPKRHDIVPSHTQPRQASQSSHAYSAFSPAPPSHGPPSLLAAEARATYTASRNGMYGHSAVPSYPSASQQLPSAPPHLPASIALLPSSSLPLADRVAVLERQRAELVAALGVSQESNAELWCELEDEKRKQRALVDLVHEVYGVVQKMNPVDLPYGFPTHVFVPRSPTGPHAESSAQHSPVDAPSISVLHHLQPGYRPSPTTTHGVQQYSPTYDHLQQHSSGMFASHVPPLHGHGPLAIDSYGGGTHSHSYPSSSSTASNIPLPPSPAVDRLMGLGLGLVGDDGIRRGAPGSAFFSYGSSTRDGGHGQDVEMGRGAA